MNTATAPRQSFGHAPLRRAGSIRRTSSIDVVWPSGRGLEMQFDARARDLFTPATDGEVRVVADDRFTATIGPDRMIRALQCTPGRPHEQELVGSRGGGHLRKAIGDSLPDELTQGTPLYLLLDDLSGASLVAGWAWSRWPELAHPDSQDTERFMQTRVRLLATMEGVCIGFQPGTTALTDLAGKKQNAAPVLPLPNPEDPLGWHDLPAHAGVAFRRSRRIDVWREGEAVHIDAMFQDSANTPDGARAAVHEYTLAAQVDPATGLLTAIAATPRVLPYPECPSATRNIQRLVGTPVRALRQTVLELLPGTEGCTHLNDAMRSLAEAPVLMELLQR